MTGPRPTGALWPWTLSSSSDPRALAVVDGLGRWAEHGPHYSRRTPGGKTFTGVGREIVLVTEDGSAVWAVVLQRTPAQPGTGGSRGRKTETDAAPRWIWRNMLFRNLGPTLSSDLIRVATDSTYRCWRQRYGELPDLPLRTEVDTRAIRSSNPGYCYKCAGWTPGKTRRHKLYLYAPPRGARADTRSTLLAKIRAAIRIPRDQLPTIGPGATECWLGQIPPTHRYIYPVCTHDFDTTKRSRLLKLPTANRCLRCGLLLGEFDEPRAQPVVAAMAHAEAVDRNMAPEFVACLRRIHRALL